MSCRTRLRLTSSVVVCLAFTYIVLFNGLALYSLTKSTYTPPSVAVNRGRLYLAYLGFKSWKCKTPHFSKQALPLTALVSFPGSGNTWVRHILQQATGINTGSVYRDYVLKVLGFPGEGVQNSSVLVIKTHEWGVTEREKYQRAILVLRNPKDSLLAEFNRKNAGHIGHAKTEDFKQKWIPYVNNSARHWLNMTKDWLNFTGDLHIVRYEQLKADPINEIKRLLNFLQIHISQEELMCVYQNMNGRFKRPRKNVTDYGPYSSEMRSILVQYEQQINEIIDQRYRYTPPKNYT
ncbi:WSCD family member CG9164-like [Saccostrea echinata]|uniref:WSCD family member CG9164-like n=1 Tax=Saccostrea echinata TaxID=191078 RepID=UPI002A7FE343|nr:WSCD family member CG9164-like [Saccostrea echinata]XP_061163274.1 WSCD family member CG9164-like [Saccostrea echinata]